MICKKIRFQVWSVILMVLTIHIYGQNHQVRLQTLDVLHYDISISLSDTSDMIFSDAVITLLFKQPVNEFTLDLADKDEKGKGMTVKKVTVDGKETGFKQQNDSLFIYYHNSKPNSTAQIGIKYSGIPADGLIISKNKFGERTFFGDNWPDRARNWFPCVDHPSDKATVGFEVTAPEKYEVIANGDMVKEVSLNHDYKLTRWNSEEPLPTKVMVVGVADFAINKVENNLNIPISTWVYPQNEDKGFADYLIAPDPLAFYISHIGPYPFTKLANVQSTTWFGGMENAGNIFYREDLVTGEQKQESLIAHEIAHQWFGNSISEGDWHHVWLSEGFATYLTDLYNEYKYGKEIFKSRMDRERKMVIRYAARNLAPIIDTTILDYRDLLNINSYEKAAWFLHMLRKELGNQLFMESIRTFYDKYQYSNALTIDFQNLVESLYGKDLDSFFEQWLYKAGHPVINITWYQKKRNILVRIEQSQKGVVFNFPLELGLESKDGSISIKTIHINKTPAAFSIPVEDKVVKLVPDPDVWLLYEGKAIRKKF